MKDFIDGAKSLARNPLGIIALFIVLIYGFASLVVGFSGNLQAAERLPIVWFLVIFPCVVLAVFSWLVSRHHTKLYAPADYREDASFIQAAQQKRVEVAAALGAAAASRREEGTSTETIASEARDTAGVVSKVVTPAALRSARARTILWVDDRPDNNRFERQALSSLGFQFVLATSTDEAIRTLRERAFDVIISDMGRPSDAHAGLTLLDAVRSTGITTPFVIYAGARALAFAEDARRRGATGTTNRPDELFEMVADAAGLTTG